VTTSPTLYHRIGGFDPILALCLRWHGLCLEHPVAAHPFEQAMHPHHDVRLAAYLAEALGGPELYTAGYGTESSVQRTHACNGEHVELDEACLALFDRALADVGVPPDVAVEVSAYFRAATEAQRTYADASHPVPDDLPLRHA
jgi:hemoglobin